MNAIKFLVVCLIFSFTTFAQQGPPRDRRDDFGPPRTGEGRGPGERGPGEREFPKPGMLSPMIAQVEAMRAWMEMVDRYARLARDPAASGVAAVIGANDLLRGKPDQAIEFFNKMLKDAKNESVQRAIRLQLVELYTKTNQTEPALEQLKTLMLAAPAMPEPKPTDSRP